MQRHTFLKASLQELESKTGICKSRWSRYFTETRSPSGKTLEKISQSLVVPQHIIQKWIMMRRENKKEVRSTCRLPSSRSMIAKNSKYSQSSMKTKNKIGWVGSRSAAHYLNLSTETLRKRRDSGDYEEGVHYRIDPSCSKLAIRVSYEYNIEAIRGEG
jgi:transcriptional regulator with XRE-family HTH domain